jgi:hypothetical protein
MIATARMVAHYQARLLADMESIHRYESENPDNLEVFWTSDIRDLAASEIQVALTLPARSAETQLDLALELCGRQIRRLPGDRPPGDLQRPRVGG